MGATDNKAFLANRIPITLFSSRIAGDTFIGAVHSVLSPCHLNADGAEQVHSYSGHAGW